MVAFALAAGMVFGSFPGVLLRVCAEETVTSAGQIETSVSDQTNALEEKGGLELAPRALLERRSGMGNVFINQTHWNNKGEFHAQIKDKQVFSSGEFTVLFDIFPTTPSGDNNNAANVKRAGLTIGTEAKKIRFPLSTGQIGYGADGAASGGTSANYASLTGYKINDWNSLAVVYREETGKNGSLVAYLDGNKAGEVADLGFRLSDLGDVRALLARSFNTSYMQEGIYDNIVVRAEAMTQAQAITETRQRAEKKNKLPANTVALEEAINRVAKEFGDGYDLKKFPERLQKALANAKSVLAAGLAPADQSKVDEVTRELNEAIDATVPKTITLTKDAIEKAVKMDNGLTWKGWGMLNGNSTSNLLLDYKAECPKQYWEMMEYLFGGKRPLFTHIKMEMGNDGNNSTGAEACTMREENEEVDVSRSPGFVMAADAKKLNPQVKISILRWGMPDWVRQKWDKDRKGAGYEAMYKWYRETIYDAYEKYGYVVDFVNPDTNETGNPDGNFIKWYAKRTAEENQFPAYFTEEARQAYRNIRIIASDENKSLNIVPAMRKDHDLYRAVDIIGFHYRTNATDDYVRMADVDNKEVWYSEGCATFGYSELHENKRADKEKGYGAGTIGGYQSPLALADSLPNAFIASRRSHYIFQPAIGSFYEGIQYAHKELISARDPWSGYIHYDPSLQVIAHFSRFASSGWEDNDPTRNDKWRMIANASHASFGGSSNEHATAGQDGDASYLTLADPSGKDMSVVFVNNTRNEKFFRIQSKDLPQIAGKSLQTWVTETDHYMQKGQTVVSTDGSWLITIPAYSVLTATTLNEYSQNELALPREGIRPADRTVLDTDRTGKKQDPSDDYLYADDFAYDEEAPMTQYNAAQKKETTRPYLQARGQEPRYMLDSHGAWIVEDGRLTQALNAGVSQWNGGDPVTLVGDFRWMNYTTDVDVQIPGADAGVWTGLGVRTQTGMNWNQDGYTLRIYGDGKWEFYRAGKRVGNGVATASAEGKYHLSLAAEGNRIRAMVDGDEVFQFIDDNPMDAGRIKLSSPWKKVYFDRLEVKKIPGAMPYATSMVDGQDDAVTYQGQWQIPGPGGGSANDWYRTLSTNGAAGDRFTFTFPVEGTGFSIIGPNKGSAKLRVQVDGEEPVEAVTNASGTRYATYTLTGLTPAKHKVTVTVESGTLVVDALYTLGDPKTEDPKTVEGQLQSRSMAGHAVAGAKTGDPGALPILLGIDLAAAGLTGILIN